MAKTDKERLATGFWNRIESNQATDCNRNERSSLQLGLRNIGLIYGNLLKGFGDFGSF